MKSAQSPLLTSFILSAIVPLNLGFTPASIPLLSSLATSSTSLASYLDSLSGQQQPNGIASSYSPAPFRPSPPSLNKAADTAATISNLPVVFYHASPEYFSLNNLASKGMRSSYDWGRPQDWSRTFADEGVVSAGTWFCTEGGWQSPNAKSVTEIFYVIEGHGMLGDADGTRHYFGPGDLVIIPKGHTGRWDVNTPIHKLWAVNDHEYIEESGPIIRVQVNHYKDFFVSNSLVDAAKRGSDPLYGSSSGSVSSCSASNILFDVGSTQVGVWTCNPGSIEVVSSRKGRWFHILQGIMFITNDTDGKSQRCVAGDTVMLPPGWSGLVDVLEPVQKLFTVTR
jgi:uncharacterized cupin superfamily protein